MGAFIARQPNGLLCRWSSIVDNLTHYNMTEEDYIEYCAERAREEARHNLQNPHFVKPFQEILDNRDEDLIFQELDVIENQEEYTSEEIVKAKSEIKRLQEVFDGNVKKMSEPVVKNGIKYRNKQIFIEAIQWTGENCAEVLLFAGFNKRNIGEVYENCPLIIHTIEGDMTANIGDYIIKGVNGDFYPYKSNIFEKIYEKA